MLIINNLRVTSVELGCMMVIFEYLDYRVFLKDFYILKKEENAFFSYRYMGRKIGMDAGYLVKVLQAKYHLATKKIPEVVAFCNFDEKEADYFETLVLFCKAKSESQTKLYFEKLISMRTLGVKTLDGMQYEFYQNWYNSAIRAVIQFFKFSDTK